jgi:hypothetical protein
VSRSRSTANAGCADKSCRKPRLVGSPATYTEQKQNISRTDYETATI